MRALWKGSIAFGLVHIPVNLYPATETQNISSNLLHKKDHSRIRYQRISEATGQEVPAEEIVRGYEVERDNFVVISDDELKEASPEKSAAIEIQEFVNESQIPTLYPNEVNLAMKLIEGMTVEFDPAQTASPTGRS